MARRDVDPAIVLQALRSGEDERSSRLTDCALPRRLEGVIRLVNQLPGVEAPGQAAIERALGMLQASGDVVRDDHGGRWTTWQLQHRAVSAAA